MHHEHSRMYSSLLHSFPLRGDITDKLGCSWGEDQSVCYWPTPSVRTSKSSLKTMGQKHTSGKLGQPLQMTRFSSIYLFILPATRALIVAPADWNTLCRPANTWPWMHDEPPTSASLGLRLQVCAFLFSRDMISYLGRKETRKTT